MFSCLQNFCYGNFFNLVIDFCFQGKMIVDNEEKKESLIDMIIKTQETSNQNNVIKFSDNSR